MSLTLAGAHARSLVVAQQCEALEAARPAGVKSCRVVSEGLVELMLAATAEGSGYAGRDWPFLVGGDGIGDEPSLALALGTALAAAL